MTIHSKVKLTMADGPLTCENCIHREERNCTLLIAYPFDKLGSRHNQPKSFYCQLHDSPSVIPLVKFG